jgi:hypothetical protein
MVFGSRCKRTRRRKVRRYNVPGSPCNRLYKRVCNSNPNCTYTKRRGCRRRNGTVKGGLVYEGPSFASFGKKKNLAMYRSSSFGGFFDSPEEKAAKKALKAQEAQIKAEKRKAEEDAKEEEQKKFYASMGIDSDKLLKVNM